MKVNVIMMSYLWPYPGARKNSVSKFIAAVNSFLNQNHKNSILTIISDGCELTNVVYDKMFSNNERVNLIRMQKQEERWPGQLRQIGIDSCDSDLITYLDTDDLLLPNHIDEMVKVFFENKNAKWVSWTSIWVHETNFAINYHLGREAVEKHFDYSKAVYDFVLRSDPEAYPNSEPYFGKFPIEMEVGKHCMGALGHRTDVNAKWKGMEIAEDYNFIEQLHSEYGESEWIKSPTYVVRHRSKYDI